MDQSRRLSKSFCEPLSKASKSMHHSRSCHVPQRPLGCSAEQEYSWPGLCPAQRPFGLSVVSILFTHREAGTLTKRVDAPDHTLSEDLVFIQGNQSA